MPVAGKRAGSTVKPPTAQPVPEPRPIGRPSEYTTAIGAEICERLMGGASLKAICESELMPARSTVMKWLADNAHPDFSDSYARARTIQADADADDIGDIARQAADGKIEPAAATAAINGLKWTAGKRRPDKYGDSSTLNHRGAIGTFDPTKCTDEQLAQLEAVLGPIAAASGDAGAGEGGEGQAGG